MSKFNFLAIIFVSVFLTSCATTNIYEKNQITMYQNDEVVGVESTFIKDGKLIEKNVESNSEILDSDDDNIKIGKYSEKVTVESTTNGGFVAYTFLGKPFVILGCTTFELLKSCGYAFINFAGGYNTFTGGEFFWVMPDVKKSKAKAQEYKEKNAIKVYPEYHKVFTDNKTTVTKITYEASTIATAEDEMMVSSQEELIYDNTLSVQLCALTDVYQTFGVIGYVGAVVTVPISATTWVLGAIYGIYDTITKH